MWLASDYVYDNMPKLVQAKMKKSTFSKLKTSVYFPPDLSGWGYVSISWLFKSIQWRP